MYKAVLFDLDGTLIDSLQDIHDAMERALSLHGLPGHALEEYRYLVGNGARVLAQRAVGPAHGDLAEAVLADYQAWYGTHNQVKTAPYPGVEALLEGLKAAGIPACVLSNKPDADTRHVVAHYFPAADFAWVQGQLPGVPTKPNPTAAKAVAERLGIAPADFLYLGDSGVDMRCAVAAGMCPVGALWGFRDMLELVDSGAMHLIARPEDLLRIVKS